MTIIGEVKEIAELVKKVGDIELYKRIVDLQASVVELSSKNLELHEANSELKAKLKKSEDWSSQTKRYTLVSPWRNGGQAYALLESDANGEQPHLLCANCFHEEKRVILNPVTVNGFVTLKCSGCRGEMATGYRGIGSPQFAEKYLEPDKPA